MNHATRWNTRYQASGSDYLFGTDPNRFLAARGHLFKPGESALLVADGEGRNSVWLAEQGLVATGMDFSPIAIEKAKALAASRHVHVRFEVDNLLAPDWHPPYSGQTFDWVIGIFIQFADPAERKILFYRMMELTRPGGRILLLGYTPKQLEYGTGGPSNPDNLYTPALLRDVFDGWLIEEMTEYEDELSEGTAHSGRSALIGLIVRKPE